MHITVGEDRMTPKLNNASVKGWLDGRAGWKRKGNALVKEFRFPSFRDSIVFVNRLAGIADQADHHPDIDIRYDTVRVALTTHDSGGITSRDLTVAEKIDFSTAMR
jgi:4a-hydroxytetrahydrobiopterin dehydratase